MIKIGLIVGKDDWYSDKIPKNLDPKYLTKKSYISSDVAIGLRILKDFPNAKLDMMLAKDITLNRLKSNDVNFILGHDLVDSFWRKPSGKYYEEFTKLYKHPDAHVFPTYPLQKFVLDKGEYYLKFKRAGVPVLPTFYIKNTEKTKQNAKYVIQKAKSMGWEEFIGKPELGAWGRMFSKWNIEKLENSSAERNKLERYLKSKKVLHFPAIIFQKSASGFKEFWEIRTYWFNGKFSHAIGTKHDFEAGDDEVSTEIDPKVLNQCKKIGKKALNTIPKMKIKGKNVKPAMMRIDCGCCLNGLNGVYFLNEIENQACNLFTDAVESMGVDVIGIFAKVLYNKALELKKLGWVSKLSLGERLKRRSKHFSSIPTPGGFEWENSPLDRALNA